MTTRLALLAFVLVGLSVPSAASAEIYVVNDTGDVADAAVGSEGCDSVAGGAKQCTLRAAIEESNNSTAADDTVSFDGTLFNGDPSSDKIAIAGSFPAITDKARIDCDLNGDKSGQCEPLTGILGPCVGVEKSGGGFGLVVEADEVAIEGLAVTGALIGINVINGSENFVAQDNWVGVKLDGSAGANNTGIFIDPTSNKATIGGTDAAQRNVVANNNNEGLDIEGASETSVLGNYFGVAPNGTTQAANPIDIDVTASTAGAFPATGNAIGGELSAAALTTPVCDGACNVISGAIVGIDLEGTGPNEAPSGGPTTIQGNYIGLDAPGTAGVANSSTGVAVGGADKVSVGGSLPGDANHINGGTFGVQAGGLGPEANELVVQRNLIGLNVAGTATLAPPTGFAIFNDSEGIADEALEATISDNRISMLTGEVILQHGSGATISGNVIGRGVGGQSLGGGTVGFRAYGNQSFGSILEGNVIDNAGEFGVLIEDDENLISGNQIGGSGTAGVRIQSFAVLGESSGNLIGGDTLGEQNTISGSGGDAIVIGPGENNENEIARNVGSDNADLFIDLGANGPGNSLTGPNGGAQPPVISKASGTGASGTAEPGALVRVFRKATPIAGEIAAFVGQAVAGPGGEWTVSYGAPIPGGTRIAATQSDLAGTSELVTATTVAPPPSSGGSGGDTKEKDKKEKAKGKAGKDKKAPETTIVKGPRARSHKRTAKFRFISSEAGSTFQCRLDKMRFKPCRSPKKYKRLKPGKHVFQVRAIDAAGNRDKTPATRKFRVLPRR